MLGLSTLWWSKCRGQSVELFHTSKIQDGWLLSQICSNFKNTKFQLQICNVSSTISTGFKLSFTARFYIIFYYIKWCLLQSNANAHPFSFSFNYIKPISKASNFAVTCLCKFGPWWCHLHDVIIIIIIYIFS